MRRQETRGELPLSTASRILALAVAVAAIALSTGTSVAAAHGKPGYGKPGPDARCNALSAAVKQLTAIEQKLSDALAAVEQRMAAGNLTRRQLAAVEWQLNMLTRQFELVDKLLVKTQELYDKLCGTASAPPSTQSPPPAPALGA
jgi:hypothetical protein